MSATLTFSAEDHVYRLDGVEVPSVTRILAAVRLIDLYTDGSDMGAAAMARGTRVHRAIEGLTTGRLDDGISIYPEEEGYLNAALAFLADSRSIPILTEHRVVHPRHRYAGTIDCLARGELGYALIDWKTSESLHALCCDLQTSAYVEALRASPPDLLTGWKPTEPMARLGVSLRADGTYRVSRYQDPRDFGIFLHALAIFNEQRRRRVRTTDQEDAA